MEKRGWIFKRPSSYKIVCAVEKGPDRQYLDEIKNTSFEPVFIAGQHRSGTSILYRILDKTSQFNVVRLYHVLAYERLLYNHIHGIEEEAIKKIRRRIHTKNIDTRGTDHISISPDSPVEYVFIYSEEFFPWYLTPDTVPYLEHLCKKIRYISDNENPILLKNPFDFSTFLFIKKVFPNAKFIFIHRNPIDVLNSQIRALEGAFTKKNQYFGLLYDKYDLLFDNPISRYAIRLFASSKIPVGLFDLIRRASAYTDYYLKNINQMPKKDYVSIRYEDLCETPNKIIGDIVGFLGLHTALDASKLIAPRHTKTVKSVQLVEQRIYKTMKPYFEAFQYSLPDE